MSTTTTDRILADIDEGLAQHGANLTPARVARLADQAIIRAHAKAEALAIQCLTDEQVADALAHGGVRYEDDLLFYVGG